MLAAIVSLLTAPIAFFVVCLVFNTVGHAPTMRELVLLVGMSVPTTVIALAASLVVAWFKRHRSRNTS